MPGRQSGTGHDLVDAEKVISAPGAEIPSEQTGAVARRGRRDQRVIDGTPEDADSGGSGAERREVRSYGAIVSLVRILTRASIALLLSVGSADCSSPHSTQSNPNTSGPDGLSPSAAPTLISCAPLDSTEFGAQMSGATVLVRARLDKNNESDIAYPNGQSEAKFAIPDAKALLGGPAPSEFVLAAPGDVSQRMATMSCFRAPSPGGRCPISW